MALFKILGIAKHLHDQLAERLKEVHGLTYTDWLALHALSLSPSTHSQLVAVLGLTKGGTTKVIQRLAKLDLVRVDATSTQRKGMTYTLTANGEHLTGHLWLRYEETNRLLQDALKPNALMDLSKKLSDALSSLKGEKPKEPEIPTLARFGTLYFPLRSTDQK